MIDRSGPEQRRPAGNGGPFAWGTSKYAFRGQFGQLIRLAVPLRHPGPVPGPTVPQTSPPSISRLHELRNTSGVTVEGTVEGKPRLPSNPPRQRRGSSRDKFRYGTPRQPHSGRVQTAAQTAVGGRRSPSSPWTRSGVHRSANLTVTPEHVRGDGEGKLRLPSDLPRRKPGFSRANSCTARHVSRVGAGYRSSPEQRCEAAASLSQPCDEPR